LLGLLGDLYLFNLDDDKKAKAQYEKIISLNQSNALAWDRLGIAQFQSNEVNEAEKSLQRAIELSEEKDLTAEAWLHLTLVYTAQRRHTEAEEAARRAIELDSSNWAGWEALGMALKDQPSKLDEAQDAFERAAAIYPSAMTLTSLADLARDHGNYRHAEESYRKAVELQNGSAYTWIALGNFLFDYAGNYSEAELAFARALEIGGPNTKTARANLIWTKLFTDRVAEAREIRDLIAHFDSTVSALIEAGFAVVDSDFERLKIELSPILSSTTSVREMDQFEDLLRLLRLVDQRGQSERFIEWFEESGNDLRLAPIQAAFTAYVHGRERLLDFSPEVREPAREILLRLGAQRSPARKSLEKSEA
jgi:tetratricopeptide (TPR) repeat protein